MVIRAWHLLVVLSLVRLPCRVAKPFSLNEAIAAEERQRSVKADRTTRPNSLTGKATGRAPKSFSLNELIAAETRQKQKTTARPDLLPETSLRSSLTKAPTSLKSGILKTSETNLHTRARKLLSPLKYKKKFKIKSPLKPKKLTFNKKAIYKRKNKKRHIKDEKFNRKYIPLFRSLSMLFDNILDTDTGDDSYEHRKGKYKQAGVVNKNEDDGCLCKNKSDKQTTAFTPSEETAISSTPVVQITTDEPTHESTQPVTTEAPTTETDNPTTSDVSCIRRDTNIPLLLTRNTNGSRGNHHRFGKGSRSSFHSSIERNFTRDHGDSKHNTGREERQASPEYNEENSSSSTRNYESGDGHRGRIRGNGDDTRRPVYRRGNDKTESFSQDENLAHIGRSLPELKGSNKLQIRGDETEGPRFLPKFSRGHREFVSENYFGFNSEPIQSQENHEEGEYSFTHNFSSDQRLTDRNGSSTKEVEETSGKDATVISINNLSDPVMMLQNSAKHKAPFVTIFDGYSVARDKNGANKLAEQSIRLHS